jgi:hypothetical protein
MTERLKKMRSLLETAVESEQKKVLEEINKEKKEGDEEKKKIEYLRSHSWGHITSQKGLLFYIVVLFFSYLFCFF